MRKSILLAAIISSSLSGCIHTTADVARLPVPERPLRPTIEKADLQCLRPDVYEALVRRELIDQAHIERLENIIRATH